MTSSPPPPATLAAQVRARRKSFNLTQQELGDLAGCSGLFVRELERGKRTVRFDKLEAVLEALGLEIELRVREPS